jgi:hypothetical protein
MSARGTITRALAALVLGASGGVLVTSTSASAAACSAGTGVTVVVNSSVSCDANGGGPASSNFSGAGHSLTYARKQPGFVCRVDGSPGSDPCVNASPTDAYWGLFWADGKGGGWVYSSVGVQSLNVPTGGWVAFVFQSSNSTKYPSVTPRTAAPAPTKKPSTGGSSSGGASSGSSGTSARPPATAGTKAKAKAEATASAKATKEKARAEASASPSASPSASASAQAVRDAEVERTAQESDGSRPTLWAGGLLALALVIGMGVTIWQRRARRS